MWALGVCSGQLPARMREVTECPNGSKRDDDAQQDFERQAHDRFPVICSSLEKSAYLRGYP